MDADGDESTDSGTLRDKVLALAAHPELTQELPNPVGDPLDLLLLCLLAPHILDLKLDRPTRGWNFDCSGAH